MLRRFHVGLGVPATTTDANNRRASHAYDGLGREISRTRHWDSVETTNEDGTKTTEDVKTTTTYAPCDDGACDAVEATVADCGVGYSVAPVMKVTTSAPDMPDSTAHLDMFGRAIRTSVEGFGGVDRRVDVFYDALGRTACESEPYHAGETARYTRYAHDIRNRLTGVTRPDGGATGMKYAAASNQVTATVTETVMASDGTTTKASRETKRAHNVLGELVSTTEGAEQTDTPEQAKQITTSYAYDGAGRLKTVTTGGQTTTFSYDAAGNRASVTNPNLGATLTAGTAMVSVKFDYNAYGELTERTDARGATYYDYDALGRRTCAADRGGTATWEYDQTNGTGLLKRRSYDRDTVLTSALSCAFGSDFAETYAYNTDARLETVTTAIVDDQDPAATTTLTRSHAYDAYGRLSTTTYPSSVTVKHEYNDRGYAAKLKHGSTELVNVTAQTAYGQSKTVSYGNGVQTERSYDELGRLKGIDTTRNAAAIQDNAYAWRSDGSLESRIAGAAGSRSKREERFDYDYLNRLTGATTYISDLATASRTLAFEYDLRGNLETKTSDVSSDDSVTNTYPKTSNWLSRTTIGDVEYRFTPDTSGHIERYACWDDDEDGVDDCADVDDTFIEWNARGLAEKVTLGDSGRRDADGAGQLPLRPGRGALLQEDRVGGRDLHGRHDDHRHEDSRKYYAGAYEKTVTVGGDTVERTRIGDSVVHVRTTPAGMMATPCRCSNTCTGTTWARWSRSRTKPARSWWCSATTRTGSGARTTGRRLTRAEIETLLGAHGERVSRGFTRHEHMDRTGLIHMNGRMYDPRLGRFLSPDPIVGDPTSSQSWNLYSYVGNNPLSYVDPTGLDPWDGCGWLCPDDIDAWWDWLNFLNSWWDHPHSGSDPYSASDYESPRSKAKKTLRAMDQSVADEPADIGGLGIAAADVGASILIPGYDLVRCNIEGNCDWTDWALGIGEIAVSATGVGYGVRVLAKAGIKGGAKVAKGANDEVVDLYRAVMPDELANIQNTGKFINRGSAEGKYFTTSAEQASDYARQAVRAFGDPPYTNVRTRIPMSHLPRPDYVDGGIRTYVLPDKVLPTLKPEVLSSMPIPRKP